MLISMAKTGCLAVAQCETTCALWQLVAEFAAVELALREGMALTVPAQ